MESGFEIYISILHNTTSPMIKSLLLVGLGGAAGSMLRFACQRFANVPAFPYGTLLINITGCFLIGLLWGFFQKHSVQETWKLILMTGFCGGFTTFSAFTYEGVQMLDNNKWLLFILYTGSSVIGGLFATFIGYKIFN